MNQRSLKSLVSAAAGAFALLLALVAISALRPGAASVAGGVTGIAKAAPVLTSVQAITVTSPSETTPNLLGQATKFNVLTNYGDSTSYVVVHPNDPSNPGATVVITTSDLQVNSPTNITGNAEYVYPASGIYTVTADHVQVISGTAQTTAQSEVITVTVARPIIDLVIPVNDIVLGDSAHFVITLDNVDTNLGSSILLNLGDGNTAVITTESGVMSYTYDYTYAVPAASRAVTATLVADAVYGGVYGSSIAEDAELISVKTNVALEPNSVTLPANGTAQQVVTAIVTDKNGEPVAGVEVKFILAFPGTNDTVTTGTTGADGKATTTVTAGTVAIVGTLSADAAGGTDTIPVTFGPNSVQPVTITLDIAPVFVEEYDGTSTLTATVKDINGNGVAGVQVNFTTTDGTLSGASATSNGLGQAVVTLTGPGEEAIADVEAAVNGSVTISAKGEVFFGFEEEFEDEVDLENGESIDIPDEIDDIFSDIDVILPPGVISDTNNVKLIFRRVVTDTKQAGTDGLTTTLLFDLRLVDVTTGQDLQITKPITIIFKLDNAELERLGINPNTLNIQRLTAGGYNEDAIDDEFDDATDTFVVVFGHLSRFRMSGAGEIKTFLPIQRRS